ncbi:hypothetical protein FHW58_004067 [Duganella sp. 1224]|nr:hypothetical protein [Duganella sp. 1224]
MVHLRLQPHDADDLVIVRRATGLVKRGRVHIPLWLRPTTCARTRRR